jgi:dipeptidyl aminopeptidase/acylaminoacyl peptidase
LGRKVYDLLSNKDPARYDDLLAQLDLKDSGLLDLSPVYVIDKIQAHLLLLHSRRDHHIPISESEAIVAATKDRLGSELVPFTAFDHVDPALSAIEPALAVDSVELYSYLYRLLLRLK